MGKRSKRRFKGPCCRKKTSDSDVEEAFSDQNDSQKCITEGQVKLNADLKVKPRPKTLSLEEEIRQKMAELDKRLSTSMRDLFSKIDQHSNIDVEILNKVLSKPLHAAGVKFVRLVIEEEFRDDPNILRSQLVLPEESKLYGKQLRLNIVRAEDDGNVAPFAQVNAKNSYEAASLQPMSIGHERSEVVGERLDVIEERVPCQRYVMKPELLRPVNESGLEYPGVVRSDIRAEWNAGHPDIGRDREDRPKVVQLKLYILEDNDDRLVRLALFKPEGQLETDGALRSAANGLLVKNVSKPLHVKDYLGKENEKTDVLITLNHGHTDLHENAKTEPTNNDGSSDSDTESSYVEKSASSSTADTIVSVASKCTGLDIPFTNEEAKKDGCVMNKHDLEAIPQLASTQADMIRSMSDENFKVDEVKVSTSMMDKFVQVRPEMDSIACGTTDLAEFSTPNAILKDAGVQVSDLEPMLLGSFSKRFSSVPAILLDTETSHVAKTRMYFACGTEIESSGKEKLLTQFDPKEVWNFTPFDLYRKRVLDPVPQHKGASPFKFMNAKHSCKSRLSRFTITIPPVQPIPTFEKTNDGKPCKPGATSSTILSDQMMEPDIVMPVKPEGIYMEQKMAGKEVESLKNRERDSLKKEYDVIDDVGLKTENPNKQDQNDTLELSSGSRKDGNGEPIHETFSTECFQVPNLRLLCKNMFMETPSYVSNAQQVIGYPKLSSLALRYTEAAYQRFKTEVRIRNKEYTSVQSLRNMCGQLLGVNTKARQGPPKTEEKDDDVDRDISQELNKHTAMDTLTRQKLEEYIAKINKLGRDLQKYAHIKFDFSGSNEHQDIGCKTEHGIKKKTPLCGVRLKEQADNVDVEICTGQEVEKETDIKYKVRDKLTMDTYTSHDSGHEHKNGKDINIKKGYELKKDECISKNVLCDPKRDVDFNVDFGQEIENDEDVNIETCLRQKKDISIDFEKELDIDTNITNNQERINGVDEDIEQEVNRCAGAHIVKEPDQNKPAIDIDVGQEEIHINKDNAGAHLTSMNEAVQGQFGATANLTQRMTHTDLKVKELKEDATNDLVQFRRQIPELHDAPKTPMSNFGFTVNLRDLMEKNKDSGVFTELHAQFLCINILRKLKAFHSQGIIHASITPRRVVFNAAGYPTLIPDIPIPTRKIKPRIEYSSPEHISSDPITMATDIFQTGLLVYTVFTGKSPYLAETHEQTKENLLNEDFTPELDIDRMSKDGRYFIRKCLKKNPDLRFKLVKCRKSLDKAVKWFSTFKEETLANQTFPSPFKDLVMAQLT